MKTTIYLIRHAETVWNRENRVQGFQDSPLSEAGEKQARRLQGHSAASKIKAAYASDAGRCLQTARLALEGTNIPLTPLDTLRERNLGIWEGRTMKEVIQSDPAAFETYKLKADYRPPNGETFLDVMDRIFEAVRKLAEKHAGEKITIFTSGGPIRAVFMKAFQAHPDSWANWTTGNGGVSTVEIQEGRWRMINFNVVPGGSKI